MHGTIKHSTKPTAIGNTSCREDIAQNKRWVFFIVHLFGAPSLVAMLAIIVKRDHLGM